MKAQYVTEDQYKQILSLLGKESGGAQTEGGSQGVGGNQTNVAGTVTCLMSKVSDCNEWIIDSGATHHIATNEVMLKTGYKEKASLNDKVYLPIGDKAIITHIG